MGHEDGLFLTKTNDDVMDILMWPSTGGCGQLLAELMLNWKRVREVLQVSS